jgi:ArsR family transcriptional regulator
MQDDPTPTVWRDYLDLQRALRALGDELRLNLVRILANGGEMKVTDLALALDVSQPLVSWHLSALRRTGLVVKSRRGREVYISLDLARYRSVTRRLGALIEPEDAQLPGPPPVAAGLGAPEPLA